MGALLFLGLIGYAVGYLFFSGPGGLVVALVVAAGLSVVPPTSTAIASCWRPRAHKGCRQEGAPRLPEHRGGGIRHRGRRAEATDLRRSRAGAERLRRRTRSQRSSVAVTQGLLDMMNRVGSGASSAMRCPRALLDDLVGDDRDGVGRSATGAAIGFFMRARGAGGG